MAKFAVLLVVALAFGATLAAPKKNQNQKPGSQLDELQAQVDAVIKDVSNSLEKVLPNTNEISKTLTEQTKQLAHNLETTLTKIQGEIQKNKGTANDALKNMHAKLTETLVSLQKLAGEDATKKANEIRTQLDANLKKIGAEFDKLKTAVEPHLQQAGDSISTFAKGIFNDMLETGKQLNSHIQNAIQEANKKN